MEEEQKNLKAADIPEFSVDFYNYLRFQGCHIYGKYDIKAWNYAEDESAERELWDRRVFVAELVLLFVMLMCAGVLSIMGGNSLSAVPFCFAMFGCVNLTHTLRQDMLYNEDAKKKDDLRMAAKYEVMCELLERQLEMK